jgi:hypothetical protein
MPYIGNQPYQGVIDSGNIVDGSIQTGDLANSAVTTAKIADSNITTTKIADTGVTVAKLNSDVTQLITQGGGPKITGVAITNSSWTVLDDTAVDTAGGYIKLTGTNFVTGCSVVVGTISATAVTFTSSTELRVQLPAQAAGTYILYVTNPDGGTAIRVNAVTYSATPSWVTSSTLPQQDDGVAISIQLSATSATTYALQAGSTLPSGLTLTSGGLLSGTVSGLASDTSYSFTVVATDAELQDSPRAFTVNIAASDTYFNLTTLLINGDTAPNVLTDASSNNFNLTAYGDARASNFSPYGTGWSNYFDGSGDYLYAGSNVAFQMGTGDFTYECYVYHTNLSGQQTYFARTTGNNNGMYFYKDTSNYVGVYYTGQIATSNITITTNQWYHLVATRLSGTLKIFINGAEVASVANTTNLTEQVCYIGADSNGTAPFFGYISNARILKGTGYSSITVPTQPLTAIANTSLLTCHANRLVDGSANNFAITRNGDVAVRSFNPFNITNTGTAGSIYFDGTDDYVTVGTTASNAFAFSGDFTIEAWFYKPGNGSDTYEVLLSVGDGNGTNGFFLELDDTRSLAPRLYMNTGALVLDGYVSSKINDAQWHHIACVRSGSNCAMFYDGTRVATSTSSASLVSSASALYIGRIANSSTNDFYGYVSDVRIINGTAAYNPTLTTITVPTIPLTAVTNTQLLTHQYKQPHNNHGFQDSSTNNHLITRNGNTTQGTFSPFSPAGWSGYFNGSSVARVNTDAGLNILSYSALECWVNLSSLGSNSLLCGRESNFWFGYNYTALGGTANKFLFSIYNGSSFTTVSSSTSPLANTWYHILGIRDGTTMRFYLNGVQENTATFSTSPSNGSAPFWMGGNGGSGSVVESFTGYLSNIRFITGATNSVAPYVETNSGNSFTPLTTNLSSVTGTQLLICQTNRFVDNNTVTTAKGIGTFIGAPSIQAYSPFKPTAAYLPTTHGGSAYFDGSDTLTVSQSLVNTLTTMTIEGWFYINSSAAYQGLWGGGVDLYGINLQYQETANQKLHLFIGSGGAWSTGNVSNTSLVPYTWYHIAYVRSGTSHWLYINGVVDSSINGVTNSVTWSGSTFYIGVPQLTTRYYNGYVANFRISNSRRYNADFTPPTSLLSSDANTIFLLNGSDAAVRDSSGRLVLETVGDSKVSSVQKKYDTGAMYFDGTGDSLITPPSIVNSIGTGDFTIEFWCYPSNTTVAYRAIVASENYASVAGGWSIYQNGTGIEIYLTGGALITAASQLVASTWRHIALVRSGSASNNCKLYVNGTNVASATNTADWTGQRIFIGDNNYTGTDYFFNGYIDDLRITKYARYTANFTPPAQTFKLR